jgi:uncharacterized membrane protein YhaH (DUF805 family)
MRVVVIAEQTTKGWRNEKNKGKVRKRNKGEFASRRRWWWAIILVLLVLLLIIKVVNGPRKLSSTHFDRLLTATPIIILLFRILLLFLSIHVLPPPRAHPMRRPRPIPHPAIIHVHFPIVLILVTVVMVVVSEDAVHRRHRVGNDDARTRDLFRITRKEAVRVAIGSSIAFDLSTAFALTFTRLAFPRAKGRRELHDRVRRVGVGVT